MGYDERILIASNTTLEETTKLFAQYFDDSDAITLDKYAPITVFSGTWFAGSFLAIDTTQWGQLMVQELLGFSPNMKVIMFRANEVSPEIYLSRLIESLLELIQATQWSIAYVQGEQRVLLLHTPDGLMIHEDEPGWENWTEERLSMIKMPYKIGKINNPYPD